MALLKKGDAIGIVACSNPLSSTGRQQIRKLAEHLGTFGLRVRLSSGLYGEAGSFSLATAGNRADELMRMYEDPDIRMICDVSGGDLANTVLPFLDFSVIADNFKPFAGYSDLTAVVNAITVKTGRINFLYQIRHLEDPQYGVQQSSAFYNTFFNDQTELFDLKYRMLQGNFLEGKIAGGNARCLLKLAGTEFWPDFSDRILFLEANSGLEPQLFTFFTQLKLLGVFDRIRGLVLGTFTQMDAEGRDVWQVIREFLPGGLPVVQTPDVGHYPDAKLLKIGDYYSFHS